MNRDRPVALLISTLAHLYQLCTALVFGCPTYINTNPESATWASLDLKCCAAPIGRATTKCLVVQKIIFCFLSKHSLCPFYSNFSSDTFIWDGLQGFLVSRGENSRRVVKGIALIKEKDRLCSRLFLFCIWILVINLSTGWAGANSVLHRALPLHRLELDLPRQ